MVLRLLKSLELRSRQFLMLIHVMETWQKSKNLFQLDGKITTWEERRIELSAKFHLMILMEGNYLGCVHQQTYLSLVALKPGSSQLFSENDVITKYEFKLSSNSPSFIVFYYYLEGDVDVAHYNTWNASFNAKIKMLQSHFIWNGHPFFKPIKLNSDGSCLYRAASSHIIKFCLGDVLTRDGVGADRLVRKMLIEQWQEVIPWKWSKRLDPTEVEYYQKKR